MSLVSVLPQRLALPPPPRPPRRPHPSGPPWRGGGWWRRALRCPLTRLPPSGSHPSLPDRAPLWPTDPWRRTPALPSGCPPGRPASPPSFPGKSGHRNSDRKHITQWFKLFFRTHYNQNAAISIRFTPTKQQNKNDATQYIFFHHSIESPISLLLLCLQATPPCCSNQTYYHSPFRAILARLDTFTLNYLFVYNCPLYWFDLV